MAFLSWKSEDAKRRLTELGMDMWHFREIMSGEGEISDRDLAMVAAALEVSVSWLISGRK